MERIASFSVDHLLLEPGVYVSRIDRDPATGAAVTTFDLRLTTPNKEPVMNTAECHTIVRELFEFVAGFEGDVPGAAPEECGNYLDQNLPMANWLARRYLDRDLADIDEKHLHYQQA